MKTKEFSKRQIEAMRIVYSDLDFIKKEWGENIDDDSLRRNSAVIRQLLVDEGGLLMTVAGWLNSKIRLKAPKNPLLNNDIKTINFFCAGGGKHNGAILQSAMEKNYKMSAEEIKEDYKRDKKNKSMTAMNIKNFLNIPTLIINGESFNRIEIIKFVANKSGGAHFEVDEKQMARMRHLEEAKDVYKILDKQATYFEFLSIGQLLVKTKYIDKLKSKIRKIIS